VVEIAEKYADSDSTEQDLETARRDAAASATTGNVFCALLYVAHDDAVDAAWETGYSVGAELNQPYQDNGAAPTVCDLFRDTFGNPFRPVSVDRAWRTSNVVALAEAIYKDRAFDRLLILADALEDAGCGDAAILEHCRGPGPHVRGCWVVDLLLGKE
jgi:hypothetical protein